MAAPWIRVESNMVTHPKTYDLAEALGLKSTGVKPNVIAAGLMVGIWSWAVQHASDGNLTRVSPQAIADAAGWSKSPKKLIDGLVQVGFADLDEEHNELWLHDWIDYAAKSAEYEAKRKAETAERVKRHRNKSKGVTETQSNAPSTADDTEEKRECNGYCNVTETQSNAPYITLHNITLHNTPQEDRKDSIDSATTVGCNGYEPPSSLPTEESWEQKKQKAEAIMARYRRER